MARSGSGNNNAIANGRVARPEFDQKVKGKDSDGVISIVNECRLEAEEARRDRMDKNDKNWDAYLGRQDFSHKQEGQSAEFLPKTAVAIEQMAALVKRGLVQFGPFYDVQLGGSISSKISGHNVRNLLDAFLDDLWGPNNLTTDFATQISDAVKQALPKALVILKCHGGYMTHRDFVYDPDAEPGDNDNFEFVERQQWHARIDVVRVEDYYPDPSGSNLYEIHRVERDLHEIKAMVDEGIYEKDVYDEIVGTHFTRPDDEELQDKDRNQNESTEPSFRKKVVIDEFWGTLLDSRGEIAHRNCVCAVANEKYLIRKPEPNPWWHQESPFVVAPLVRVPFSVWHKSLFDEAVDLNLALNEIFNLMIDGGIAAVWGIKQLRTEDLEDPSQVENGIKQGMTLAVKQTLPHNAKVLENVTEGEVPPEAMQMFEAINSEFTTAAMTNELKMGSMPPRAVLATEVLESSQSQNMMLDGVISDLENNVIERALRLTFLNVLQMADDVPETAWVDATDRIIALLIMRSSPAERYALFNSKAKFKVNGLSATMTKALDFQKFMALLQAVRMDPSLAQEWMRRYSPSKALSHLIRILGLNPDDFGKTMEEMTQAMGPEGQIAGAAGANQFIQGGPQNAEGQPAGVAAGPGTGGDPMTAQIQQQANPATGMPPMIGQ